jgi:hypothetical protein
MVKVRYSEGVAIHTDPESCAGHCREAVREALIGGRIGEVWSGESNVVRGADAQPRLGREGIGGGSEGPQPRPGHAPGRRIVNLREARAARGSQTHNALQCSFVRHLGVGGSLISSVSSEGKGRISR